MSVDTVNPLMALAIVLLSGLLGGNLARRIGLPHVVGQILMGVILGPAVCDLFLPAMVDRLGIVTEFALGFITLSLGERLNFHALRNAGRRLSLLFLAESLITPVLVAVTVHAMVHSWGLPLLLGAMAVSTAPATVVALVKETRSRGVFVKTLMAAVALNNIACIVLFALAQTVVKTILSPGAVVSVPGLALVVGWQIGGSMLLGGLSGAILVAGTRHEMQSNRLAAATLVALLLVCGLALFLHLSLLLSCLFLGVALANLMPRGRDVGITVFENMETAVFAMFFTLAGVRLEFGHMAEVGLLAVAVVGARFVGKLLAAHVGMWLAGATPAVRRYLGLGLVPQAGVAVGLILFAQEDPGLSSLHHLILTVGLSSVMLNELIGSLTLHGALRKSGEAGKDRPRLMDFLEEEHIAVDLDARTKEEAIAKLADLMIRTHHLKVGRDTFVKSILDREAQASTCMGEGLAIPHATLEEGSIMAGVMGLSRRGLHFDTPDGRPVHCMVLLATSPSQRNRHLQVMASLARAVGRNPEVQRQLFNAKTAAHAHDVLHAEESEDFNYYLSSNGTTEEPKGKGVAGR